MFLERQVSVARPGNKLQYKFAIDSYFQAQTLY